MSFQTLALTTTSIFISKKLNEDSPFMKLKEQFGIKIIDESLIETSQIRYSSTPQTKWIFFSSKNAINYFFAQNPELPEDVSYGVMGDSSAKHLLTFGKDASFIGKDADAVQIAKDFREILKDDSVLFPQAIDSLQTIQKQLSFTNTCYNLYVYKTTLKTEVDIAYTDVLIFTSPSNVAAFFTKNKISSKQTVIAMGSSTKFKLAEYGVKNALTPSSFNEDGLLDIIVNQPILEKII